MDYDRELFESNPSVRYIIGLDEAGRGPLAGPLSVGLYVLEKGAPFIDGVDDSKQMTLEKRESLFGKIANSGDWKSRLAPPGYVDQYNIYDATRRVMTDMVLELSPEIRERCLVVTDAMPLELPDMRQLNPVKGDALSYTVGCASIIAKVIRDREMVKLDTLYPGYGFARNKGYGTKEHLGALSKLGPSPAHRYSFAPVKKVCSRPEYDLFHNCTTESEEP